MASCLSRQRQVVGQDAFAMQCRQQGGQQAFLSVKRNCNRFSIRDGNAGQKPILGMGEQEVEVSAGFSAASERTTGCHLHTAHLEQLFFLYFMYFFQQSFYFLK